MKKYFFLSVAVCGLLFACKHEIINPGGNNTDTTGNGGNGVCFERDVLPILATSCAKSGCHNAASQEGGYRLDSYANIIKKGIKPGNANDSKIYKVIVTNDPGDRMPQPPNAPLTAAQVAIIRQWINEGAQNTTNCAPVCNASNFTYSAYIKPLIDNKCLACHNPSLPRAGYDFSTHSGLVQAVTDQRLLGSINRQSGFIPMPDGSLPKLSDCEIQQITNWVNAGTPNN